MKLYRIYRKEAFVTRLELDEVEIAQPSAGGMPAKISIMPGVPKQVCEMVAAHWAERRVTVPATEKIVDSVIPEHTEQKQVKIPGHYETRTEYVEGHYETQEIWIPEHEEHHVVEVPGYYEERRVLEPGQWEIKNIWVPEYYVTRYYWREASPARGLEAAWIPYQELIPAGYKDQRVWVEGRWVRKQFWVDATFEYQTVVVPGQYRDHRVWIDGDMKDVQVWVPDTYVLKEVIVPEMVISTPVIVPEHVERQTYWKEEYQNCWMTYPEQTVIAGVPVTPEYLSAMGEWFAWYQTTPAGQMFLDGAKTYGWLDEWTSQQVMHKAYEMYRHFQPEMGVRIAPDTVVKFFPAEVDNMLRSKEGIYWLRSKGLLEWATKLQKQMIYEPKRQLTDAEISMLIKAGAIAGLVAAAVIVVYYTWPGAKFELTVSFPDPVYVGRYLEQYNELDLVGVSPKGTPTFYRCPGTGGPIMGETRSRDRDEWFFGEEWKWSAFSEEARWMGIGETRYWTEFEVEYLGMLSRSGAMFYMLHSGRMEDARGGHDPGWTKPTTLWGTWEELEHHIRI